MLAATAVRAAAQNPYIERPRACGAELSSAGGALARRSPAGAGVASVAILPIDDQGADRSAELLAFTLQKEIPARLRDVEQLHVVPDAATARAVATYQRNPAAIAHALGAQYVLDSRLVTDKRGIHLAYQLVSADGDSVVWRHAADGPRRALFAQSVEVVRGAVTTMLPRLSAAGRRHLDDHPAGDAVVQELLAEGEYQLAQGTPDGAKRAVAPLLDAASRDASLAVVQARIAQAYAVLLEAGRSAPRLTAAATLEQGIAAARRSTVLDRHQGDGWIALGDLLRLRSPRSYAGVRNAYERGVRADPRSAEALRALGALEIALGQESAAQTHLERAASLADNPAGSLTELARLRVQQRRFTNACVLLNEALGADPRSADTYVLRALVRLRMGEGRDAWADAETATRLGETWWGPAASVLAYAYARDTATAVRRARDLVARLPDGRPLRLEQAGPASVALLATGATDRALVILERISPRGAALWAALRQPWYDAVRHTRAFERLAAAARPAGGGR